MSEFEFSRLPAYRRKGSQERLLRAAIYAFCSLPRPTRRESGQLEDLALPLVEKASIETRRYVAAALSECTEAPRGLVRRLCEEPVEIAAPLLMRSRALSDIDLIALIGRHGMGHARAIARRRDLNPRIAELVATLEKFDLKSSEPTPAEPKAVEETREKLRSMMVPAGQQTTPSQPAARAAENATSHWRVPPGAFDRLRSAALTGLPELFRETLARSLGLAPEQARALASGHGRNEFPIAMRALDLSAEQGFLIAACVFGGQFGHAEAIRLFLDRFAAISPQAARATVRDWKMSAAGVSVSSLEAGPEGETIIPAPANEAGASGLLKVS